VNLNRENVGDVAVVAVQVEYLDASNSKAFKRDLTNLLGRDVKVVVELDQVKFVDSSGCGTIISCLRQLKAAGGDMKLCGVTKPVRTIFELVRLHSVIDIFNTRDEAVKAFQI
jgi:anti-sigma B factor antagonist